MFEGLKKKLSEFANSIANKEKEELQENQEGKKAEPEKPKQVAEPGKAGPDIALATKIKGAFLGSVKLSEKDIAPFVEDLKLSLIKSDVNYEVAEKLAQNIESKLVNKEVKPREASKEINEEIRQSINELLSANKEIDIAAKIREKAAKGEPYKILFIGPNGAGKTTTIAKIAAMLKQQGISCVLAASDTFRAAAIEQIETHAQRLGIEVIKGKYGADPASVAFDAIAHASSRGISCVLIDTAGRQETNKSLIEEVKKIERVNKPDMVLFIGESIAGNQLLEQVKEFNEAVHIDGIILTKLDCDAKGGNTLSILSETQIPVLFFGIGENYKDLIPYDRNFILSNLLPNN